CNYRLSDRSGSMTLLPLGEAGWLEIKFCHNSPRGCGPSRKNSEPAVVAGLGPVAPLFVEEAFVVEEPSGQRERATYTERHDLIRVGAVAVIELALDVRLVAWRQVLA